MTDFILYVILKVRIVRKYMFKSKLIENDGMNENYELSKKCKRKKNEENACG